MPLGVTTRNRFVIGDRVALQASVTFDSSYPTGGEDLTPSLLGGALQQIDWVECSVNTAGNRLVVWDRANRKLLLFTALGTEAANASNQATIVAEVTIFGK